MSETQSEPPVWSPFDLRREHLLNNFVTVVALLFWARVLLYALNQQVPRPKYGVAFLAGGVLIYVLDELRTLERGNRLERLGLWICAVVGTAVPAYVWLHYDVLETQRIGYALGYEYIIGGLFGLVVLYLTYRSFGAAFAGVVIASILYAYFGNLITGLLSHGGIAAEQIINVLTMEFDGFFGSITQVVAVKVALFLLYAGLMRGYGAFDLIMRLSFRTAKYLRSGVAQSAVISSLIVGSINGAQTANAAMTGSFTIPLMKESGMRSDSAGGIEAVASSGGQIMPPVMGAAAFVMASLIPSIGYVDVLVAGVIPALVFYISVAIGVHYMAVKQLPEGGVDIESRLEDLGEGYHPIVETIRFGVPFAVLLYTLGIAQWTVISSALYTCAAMVLTGSGLPILLSFVDDDADPVGTVRDAANNTVSGFKFGAVAIAPIAIIIAAVNGIVDLLNATGLPGKLSLAIVGVAGGLLLFTALLSMVVCLVLGLGMPTVAAYTIVALLIAPTLTGEFALDPVAAHFFVFYAAILSGITPPIAISVVVTAGIAGSNFWRTALEALKLGLPLFVLPFTFIYNPEIVTGGFGLTTAASGLVVLFGAIAITHGLNCAPRPFGISSPLSYGVRAVYVALGVAAMVWPGLLPRVGAVAAAILFIALQTQMAETTNIGHVAEGD
ncbi:C4-dicarboxylate ABC transporter permease [Natrinema saccharevitans]|uniref:C4-dicarboxylate ABC transporter permease n=1 Tax=Natrinema saccharevitans TaxID=301967 RepID=A0A1S8AS04_9EURY|nr:TRAP transporter fused permease subunit [Natrinema saccharevitans]OLZ39422.1 C4-dicarboxylate ABC transporter permease [Natrinema saccharevitans]